MAFNRLIGVANVVDLVKTAPWSNLLVNEYTVPKHVSPIKFH
jgi:hypothetical protein